MPFLLLLTVAACRPAEPGRVSETSQPTIGTSHHTITVDGRARTFLLYRPVRLATPTALVVMLHGGFGSGEQAESSYGWDAMADREGFVVAYPDGLNRAWNVGGGCCGAPGSTNVDDVAFITTMVSTIGQSVPLDRTRVYATGISNGGMLAYRLACDTDVFAAIGPDSATLLGACPSPHPVSVLHIHGTADRNIPYDGSPGEGVARIDGPPVPDVIAMWRATDRCGPPAATTVGAVMTSLATCPHGRAVELITIDGAGHQWPGARSKPIVERALGLDPPSTALDATETLWHFFATHSR
jgi:polyhydroxybutyrate depolymerase